MKKEQLNNTVLNYATTIDLGIDLGNGYTKVSGMKFPSKVGTGSKISFNSDLGEVHNVNYDGGDYIVGDGAVFLGEQRYFSEKYKIALFTAIATACKGLPSPIGANICVGLPLNNYERNATKLRKHLESLPVTSISVDGEDYIIGITNVTVFPEGALGVIEEETVSVLTVDIGSGTINVVEWRGMTPVNETTIPKSMLNLNIKVRDYLNKRFNADVTKETVGEFVGKDFMKIAQQTTDISSHKSLITDFVGDVMGEIEAVFSVRSIEKIKLLGGGAILLHEYFQKIYPEVELVKNAQFINSEVYQKVAELHRQKK